MKLNINLIYIIYSAFMIVIFILLIINNHNTNKNNANNARYMYQIGWNKGLKAGLTFDEANGDTLINFWKYDSICAEKHIKRYYK